MGEIRLICPGCGAEYLLDEDAIPTTGRMVECGSCGKLWRQPKATARAAAADAGLRVSPLATAVAHAGRKAGAGAEAAGTTAEAAPQPGNRPSRPQPAPNWPPKKITPRPEPQPSGDDATPKSGSEARTPAQPAPASRQQTEAGVTLNRPLPDDVFDILTQEAAREARNRRAEAAQPAAPTAPPPEAAPRPTPAPQPDAPKTGPSSPAPASAPRSDSIGWPSGKVSAPGGSGLLPTDLVGAVRHIHARPQQPPAQPDPDEMAAKVTRTTPSIAHGSTPEAAPVPPLAADTLAYPPRDPAPPAPPAAPVSVSAPKPAQRPQPARTAPVRSAPEPAHPAPRRHAGNRGFTAAVLLALAALALYLAAPMLADQQPWGPELMALRDQVDQGRLWLFQQATALVDPLIARLSQPGQ